MDRNEVDQVDQMGRNEDQVAGLAGQGDLRREPDQDRRPNRRKDCFLPRRFWFRSRAWGSISL